MSINPSTNTSIGPTKADYGMNLAGRQVISGGIFRLDPNLPGSPAQGAPLYEQAFDEGCSWSQVEGYIDSNEGNGAI